MSDIWPHATKRNPCPICNKPDWCQFGEKAMKCMRVESTNACSTGGWYHFYDEGFKRDYVPKSKPPARSIPAGNIMRALRDNTTLFQFEVGAREMGVLKEALVAVGAAWHPEKRAWAFPMHDSNGDVVGIRLRSPSGFKWAVDGSRNGVFLPVAAVPVQPVAFLPEGATDTVAAISLGFYAVGRPTDKTGNEVVAWTLKRLGVRRAVIVADNDEMKTLGNREGRPGIEGALKLKKELRIPSVIWIPPSPIKDMREFVRKGGTRLQVESEIKQKTWTVK